MRSRNQKVQDNNFSILTPWETDNEESAISKYCSDFADHRKPINFPNIDSKRRAASHCAPIRNQNIALSLFEKVQKLKTHQPLHETTNIRTHQTSTQHSNQRTQRLQKRKAEKCSVLQQLSVKNFIIEGGNQMRQKLLRKRESSYILKQKFAEFRRSGARESIGKENGNMRIMRYQL